MDVEALSAKPRLRLLLDHFARIKDTRQSWKVAYEAAAPAVASCYRKSMPRMTLRAGRLYFLDEMLQ